MENPIKMDDLGVPLFSKTSISSLKNADPWSVCFAMIQALSLFPQKKLQAMGIPWVHPSRMKKNQKYDYSSGIPETENEMIMLPVTQAHK